jgi:ribosomal protein S18 acetylase RimI-like enzyme
VFPVDALERLSADLERRADFWRGAIDSRSARSHILVGHTGDHVAGFSSVGPTNDDDLDSEQIGELYSIYVLPEASGKGVGRALMAELLQRLRQEHFDEAILWVLEDNPRTRTFYERAGWRLDGAVKHDTFFGTPVREIRYRIALRS